MKLKSFGLDIGASFIRAVWLGKQDSKIFVQSISLLPTPKRGIMSESQIDQKNLSDSIKKLVGNANITTSLVNISIPESQVFSKIIEMPDLADRELDAALMFELERQIPMPLVEVKTDWQILSHKEKDGKKTVQVLLVAVSLNILEKYERIISGSGLAIQSIESEIISVYRALTPALEEQADLIAHISSSTTDLVVTINKVIVFTFAIPIGGFAIDQAIALDFGVDVNQIENLNKIDGFDSQFFEKETGKSLVPILSGIISDIRKATLLFKEKFNQEIKRVILSGRSSLLPGIDSFFASSLNIPVVQANVWLFNDIENVPEQVAEEGPSYSVVLGLALREKNG